MAKITKVIERTTPRQKIERGDIVYIPGNSYRLLIVTGPHITSATVDTVCLRSGQVFTHETKYLRLFWGDFTVSNKE